jgi:ferredoxin
MKDAGFLPAGKEKEFVEALAKKAHVYVPVEDGDAIVFSRYKEGAKINLSRPANTSPKLAIFPQSEALFRFTFRKDEQEGRNGVTLDANLDFPETVIVGGRPCDAKGFTVYDRVYLNKEAADPYYAGRRAKTAIVSLTCPGPYAGCFCVAVDGGPASPEGSDVLMTEVKGGYYVQAVTEKGKGLIDVPVLQDGGAQQAEAKKAQEKASREVGNPFQAAPGPDVSMELFNLEEFWQKATDRCVSCGACTFLCPTCYCFNITDEYVEGTGERVRSWDACMFHHFTLEASGHNPRPQKYQRYRQRVGHKFVYYPEKYSGVIACVGCGRCIRYCPVSIDISEVVANLRKGAGTAAEKSAG